MKVFANPMLSYLKIEESIKGRKKMNCENSVGVALVLAIELNNIFSYRYATDYIRGIKI